jgi:hypothetical protein
VRPGRAALAFALLALLVALVILTSCAPWDVVGASSPKEWQFVAEATRCAAVLRVDVEAAISTERLPDDCDRGVIGQQCFVQLVQSPGRSG